MLSSLTKVIVASLVLVPIHAFAHEHQIFEINGNTYDFTVGSLNEPVAVDDKTGVDLTIKTTGTGGALIKPVVGLEATLDVEILADGQSRIIDLTAAWGKPGSYYAGFYPTVETMYQYRIFGTLNDTPIDLVFSCNHAGHVMHGEEEGSSRMEVSPNVTRIGKRGSFGCPKPKGELGFPVQTLTLHGLTSAVYVGIGLGIAALLVSITSLVLLLRARTKK